MDDVWGRGRTTLQNQQRRTAAQARSPVSRAANSDLYTSLRKETAFLDTGIEPLGKYPPQRPADTGATVWVMS